MRANDLDAMKHDKVDGVEHKWNSKRIEQDQLRKLLQVGQWIEEKHQERGTCGRPTTRNIVTRPFKDGEEDCICTLLHQDMIGNASTQQDKDGHSQCQHLSTFPEMILRQVSKVGKILARMQSF